MHELSYTQVRPPYKRISEPVETFNQLSQRLNELEEVGRASRYYTGVEIKNNERDTIAIGLAAEGWLLIFDDHTHTNMRWSIGDEHALGDVEYQFQEWESLSKRHLIYKHEALDTLQTWLETGQLSNAVQWEDNPY
jgi:hypothetical protein